MAKLKVLDLFSGIGGFSKGLEATGYFETAAFCEVAEFPKQVLRKHWPEVPQYDDVRELSAERLAADGVAVDAICGGFPCQDISLAGAGAGLDGERSGLWSEIARLTREIRPRFVIVENVSALLGRGLDRVLRDLASIGYDAEWHCIPASYVGLRHIRDRIWIVAYPQCYSLQGRASFTEKWREKTRAQQLARLVQPRPWPTISSARDSGTGHGVPNGIHRNKAIGNAVVPHIPELIGWTIADLLRDEQRAAA